MVVVLNREALVTLLVDMPRTTGVIVSMVPHRVRTTYPSHEAAHFDIDQRTRHKMIVIGHQLERKQLNLVHLKSFKGSDRKPRSHPLCETWLPEGCLGSGRGKALRLRRHVVVVASALLSEIRKPPINTSNTASTKRRDPFDLPVDLDVVLDAMHRDTNVSHSDLRFVLPTKLGHVELRRNIDSELVRAAIER